MYAKFAKFHIAYLIVVLAVKNILTAVIAFCEYREFRFGCVRTP
jgi:hypothetical protein